MFLSADRFMSNLKENKGDQTVLDVAELGVLGSLWRRQAEAMNVTC